MSRRTKYFAKQKGASVLDTAGNILDRQNKKTTKSSRPMKEETAKRIAAAIHKKGANK